MPPVFPSGLNLETSIPLEDELEVPSVVSWTGDQSMPADLPALIYALMGENCLQRLIDFSQWPTGWNGGASEAISWPTYENLQAFLSTARFRTGSPPSLFLTDEGFLEIAWDDREGRALSVTLSPVGAHFFNSADGTECDVPIADLHRLGQDLNRLTF